MARSHPSVGYPCEYLGISTFGDLPYLARVECGLGGGEVKPSPVTGSLAVVPRVSRRTCPFRWATRSPFESSGRSHAGRARIRNIGVRSWDANPSPLHATLVSASGKQTPPSPAKFTGNGPGVCEATPPPPFPSKLRASQINPVT